MNNMLIYVVYLNFFFFFFFFFSMLLFFNNYSFIMEWLIYSMDSFNLEVVMLIDWVSMIYISFIFFISSMVMMYSIGYMSGSKFLNRFVYLVMLFIMSMVIMIMSPNIFSILFGWDGLGVVSYCLVVYYQNYLSFNSGMVTVLVNRIGDICLLMLIGMMMMYGSWNLFMMKYIYIMIFFIIIAGMTKSAQIPFSVWLPQAMAAPTPVSALVHSSTLVTAGIYLLIRFNSVLMLSGEMKENLLVISILTMFMSGLMANVEFDLKKIIALSTLSQLGMMMMILSFGYPMISFYHLLTHSMFKSLLFLCSGVIIHMMNNNQDIRKFGNLNELLPFTMMSFYVSMLSLCGFPFLSGFYSKDLIMELMYLGKLNVFMLLMLLISLVFTVSYSIRLFYYLYFGEFKFMKIIIMEMEGGWMNFSMIYLMLMSVMCGAILNWMFYFDFFYVYLVVEVKMLTLIMCFSGIFFGIYIYFKNLMKLYYMNVFFSSMWGLDYMYKYIYKPVLKLGEESMKMDLTWVEYSGKNFFLWIYFKNYFLSKYKIMVFIYLIMSSLFILMMFM